MPRLAPLAREELKDFEDLWQAGDKRGYNPNSLLTLGRRPETLRALTDLSKSINAPGEIAPELKRLVGYFVSLAAGCRYCTAHAGLNASHSDISPEKIEAIWEYETNPLFSDAERAAFRFTQGAAAIPNAVSDEDFAEMRKHFSETAIVEIMTVIAYNGWLSRWNSTMGTELEAPPREFAEKELAKTGWDIGRHG